jgi:hypothetical protein
LAKDFDILILQETFVHQSTRQVSFPGFSLLKKDAVVPVRGRPVGGLGLLVSFSVLNSFRVDVEDIADCPMEGLLVKFTRLPSGNPSLPASFFILNLYVPSFPAPVDYSQLQTFLVDEFANRVQLDPFLVAGDFNCHASSRGPGFKRFREFMVDEGFRFFPEHNSPIPTFISHKGSSVIDFVFARGFCWNSNECSIISFDTFGHRILLLEFLFPDLSQFLLSPRSSFHKHVRSVPDDNFFGAWREAQGWWDPVSVLQKGITTVFSAFMLCLSSFLFEVRPPTALDEPWERYLLFSEIWDLRRSKLSVATLSRNFVVGNDVQPLVEAQRVLSSLSSSLRQAALHRFTASIRNSGDDPGSLWKTVRNFRLDPCAAQGL